MSEENESDGERITYLESVTRLLDKPCCAECVATAARKMVAMLTAADALAEVVRTRCREAVPQWAPELRSALACYDLAANRVA